MDRHQKPLSSSSLFIDQMALEEASGTAIETALRIFYYWVPALEDPPGSSGDIQFDLTGKGAACQRELRSVWSKQEEQTQEEMHSLRKTEDQKTRTYSETHMQPVHIISHKLDPSRLHPSMISHREKFGSNSISQVTAAAVGFFKCRPPQSNGQRQSANIETAQLRSNFEACFNFTKMNKAQGALLTTTLLFSYFLLKIVLCLAESYIQVQTTFLSHYLEQLEIMLLQKFSEVVDYFDPSEEALEKIVQALYRGQNQTETHDEANRIEPQELREEISRLETLLEHQDLKKKAQLGLCQEHEEENARLQTTSESVKTLVETLSSHKERLEKEASELKERSQSAAVKFYRVLEHKEDELKKAQQEISTLKSLHQTFSISHEEVVGALEDQLQKAREEASLVKFSSAKRQKELKVRHTAELHKVEEELFKTKLEAKTSSDKHVDFARTQADQLKSAGEEISKLKTDSEASLARHKKALRRKDDVITKLREKLHKLETETATTSAEHLEAMRTKEEEMTKLREVPQTKMESNPSTLKPSEDNNAPKDENVQKALSEIGKNTGRADVQPPAPELNPSHPDSSPRDFQPSTAQNIQNHEESIVGEDASTREVPAASTEEVQKDTEPEETHEEEQSVIDAKSGTDAVQDDKDNQQKEHKEPTTAEVIQGDNATRSVPKAKEPSEQAQPPETDAAQETQTEDMELQQNAPKAAASQNVTSKPYTPSSVFQPPVFSFPIPTTPPVFKFSPSPSHSTASTTPVARNMFGSAASPATQDKARDTSSTATEASSVAAMETEASGTTTPQEAPDTAMDTTPAVPETTTTTMVDDSTVTMDIVVTDPATVENLVATVEMEDIDAAPVTRNGRTMKRRFSGSDTATSIPSRSLAYPFTAPIINDTPAPASPDRVASTPVPASPYRVVSTPAPALPARVASTPAPPLPDRVASTPTPALPDSVASTPAPPLPDRVVSTPTTTPKDNITVPRLKIKFINKRQTPAEACSIGVTATHRHKRALEASADDELEDLTAAAKMFRLSDSPDRLRFDSPANVTSSFDSLSLADPVQAPEPVFTLLPVMEEQMDEPVVARPYHYDPILDMIIKEEPVDDDDQLTTLTFSSDGDVADLNDVAEAGEWQETEEGTQNGIEALPPYSSDEESQAVAAGEEEAARSDEEEETEEEEEEEEEDVDECLGQMVQGKLQVEEEFDPLLWFLQQCMPTMERP
ncbi:hypothetical protein PROFUN_08620 [Planoprotostelium fungivorum]|uniref:Uncharacterized protein n=1 Tax=Planoprotostelium fungivorum TaxID=1890364 RepID=A0A2P6NJ79_9EUKA|nr:hypothetical protein PROFUN_08620 [Planoprotostelium fungivorum]